MELLVAHVQQFVEQTQNKGHVAGDLAAASSGAIVDAKRPGRTAGVPVAHIGGENAGILQCLFQIAFFFRLPIEQRQRIAGNAGLVRLHFVGQITLATAIRRLWHGAGPAGGTGESGISPLVRRDRLFHKIVAHISRESQHFWVFLPGIAIIFQIGYNAHTVLRRRDERGPVAEQLVFAIHKSVIDKTRVALLNGTIQVPVHLPFHRVPPRRPRLQDAVFVVNCFVRAENLAAIGLQLFFERKLFSGEAIDLPLRNGVDGVEEIVHHIGVAVLLPTALFPPFGAAQRGRTTIRIDKVLDPI